MCATSSVSYFVVSTPGLTDDDRDTIIHIAREMVRRKCRRGMNVKTPSMSARVTTDYELVVLNPKILGVKFMADIDKAEGRVMAVFLIRLGCSGPDGIVWSNLPLEDPLCRAADPALS